MEGIGINWLSLLLLTVAVCGFFAVVVALIGGVFWLAARRVMANTPPEAERTRD